MLDRKVIQYTKDGILEKNLATGQSRLTAESDYAKERKLTPPEREGEYKSPYDHPERRGPPENQGTEQSPLFRCKETGRRHPPLERLESNKPWEETETTCDSPFTRAKTNRRADPEKNHNLFQITHGGENTSSATADPDISSHRFSEHRHHPGLRKPDHVFFHLRLLRTFRKKISRGHAGSQQDEDENLGLQTVGAVTRTAGRIQFGVHSVSEMKQWRSRRAAKKRAGEKAKREIRSSVSAETSSAVKVGNAVGKTSSLLKHPALIKFFLSVAAVFGGMILLCMLLGGTTGSFIGSATEHPELTSYVRQLDSDFPGKLNSVISSYSQKGYAVTVEGDESVSTDSGALAILATQDWTSIDLTPENKAKLAQCHALLNYYTVSTYDETVSSGKTKSVVHHAVILIHACTAEERIDAFGFSSGIKAHVLDMLATLRQIEAETGAGNIGGGSVSAAVLAYRPQVDKYCTRYGIQGYENLVLAVMQQESGGSGNDPMQASECGYNTRFPHVPDSITDADYSIQCGVENLASCLRAAKCKSPGDVSGISLALQGYNFGNGYIAWALQKGGYSQANAVVFSQMEAKEEGVSNYGDVDYVNHVLRYYNAIQNGGNFIWPVTGYTDISSGYGPRIDPVSGAKEEFHPGIDIPAPTGTPIHAAASGTVIYAQFGKQPYGGYGNLVIIRHSSSLVTLYGHCSKLLVSVGQTVQQGQTIAEVGQTGRATGPHCHFEVRVNGQHTDPISYLQSGKG